VVLFAVLFGACVAYGSLGAAPERNVYPDHRDLADDYDRYVGDRVVVSGEVVSTEPLVVSASDGRGGEIEYRIVRTSKQPAIGERLRVFGRATPDRMIAARDGFVVDEAGPLYAYGASALAGGWVLGRIVRHWRLDAENGLVRRAEPLWVPVGTSRRATDSEGTTGERREDGDREGDDA
jgi:hypothetical protein